MQCICMTNECYCVEMSEWRLTFLCNKTMWINSSVTSNNKISARFMHYIECVSTDWNSIYLVWSIKQAQYPIKCQISKTRRSCYSTVYLQLKSASKEPHSNRSNLLAMTQHHGIRWRSRNVSMAKKVYSSGRRLQSASACHHDECPISRWDKFRTQRSCI